MGNTQTRTYSRAECVVFLKTKEAFGGLSNMAGGFPVCVNNIHMLTSEALYQVCRFPNLPDVQKLIIEQKSPMTAKMKSKPYRTQTRPDWDHVRAKIMRWCLRVKLAQNWHIFSALLLETGERPIVEESRKDDYWGAMPVDSQKLIGMNVLGRFLMELREAVKVESRQSLLNVEPLSITDFLLFGKPIESVIGKDAVSLVAIAPSASAKFQIKAKVQNAEPPSLYDGLESMKLPVHSNRDVVVTGDKDRQSIIETTYIAESSHGMIEGLKPYAEYKESGSKWLGAVPAKWEVRNLRTLISKRAERDRPDLPLLSVAREKGVFVRSMTDADENHNVIPDDLTNYKVARAGNLVINKMKAWQGSMGIAPCDGIVSPAYFVFDFRISNHAFGQRLLRSKPYVAHFGQASDGVRVGQWDLSIPGMRQIPVLVPSDDEQAAIVRFLDHANRKIDGFIRAKRKLIGLLNEQKQAIIHRAVTRGLHPDVPLKPSGIPWLGDIPKHWDVLRAKYVFREIEERSTTGREEQLSVSHITGVTPRSEKNITMFKAESYVGHKICRPGDLAINTMWAWMAALGVSKHEGIISPAYAVYRQRAPERLLADYSDLLLRTAPYKSNYLSRSTGVRASRLRLYPEEFFKIQIIIPPLEEQREIVDSIAAKTRTLTTAIARTEREIALMQEYRTRLTADLVTGKLDVREAAAKLPVPPAEPVTESIANEPLEEIETEDADA